jgi:hypothetical protein
MGFQTGYPAADTFYNELDKRTVDYFGDSTVIGFINRMDGYLKDFRQEILKNLLAFSEPKQKEYLDLITEPISQLSKYFWVEEKHVIDYYNQFSIDEAAIINHSDTSNELYFILSNEPDNLKNFYRNDYTGKYDNSIEILRGFYNLYSRKFLQSISSYINQRAEKSVQSEAKINSQIDYCDDGFDSNQKHIPDINRNKQQARKIISDCFQHFNQKIVMSDNDFKRLTEYVDFMIENETIPPEIIRINKTALPTGHITFIFSLIHKELYGRKRRLYFIEFLHEVFTQYQNTNFDKNKIKESTTYKKFTDKPQNFYSDFPNLKR